VGESGWVQSGVDGLLTPDGRERGAMEFAVHAERCHGDISKH